MRSLNPSTQNGHKTPPKNYKTIILGCLLILLFIYFSLPLKFFRVNWHFTFESQEKLINIASSSFSGDVKYDAIDTSLEKKCNMFRGNWVPYPKGLYYTNESGCIIEDGENCMKFGRLDTDYMKWRWKPDGCELPLFDAKFFLELVRGKSMAFIGDSLARNHMQSLGCMLSQIANPIVKDTGDTKIRRWVYANYNFTIQFFSTTHLIQSRNMDPMSANPIDLYLDDPDEIWVNEIDGYDYLIISAGHWFARPLTYHEKGKVVGCHMCNTNNMTDMTRFYGYRHAFRTAFETILNSQFKGSLILRTISPVHFESETWEGRGSCIRKKPFMKQEVFSDWYMDMFHVIQREEFRQAGIEHKEKGVKFNVLDITEAMRLRPDGHPNKYGYPLEKRETKGSDCLHWCLPGAIDMWNELLLEILKRNNEGSFDV